MRRLATTTTVFTFGVLSVLLSGCPVWGPDPNPPRPDVVTRCDRNDQCGSNQYCNVATHECVDTPMCPTGGGCPGGYYCDARGACVPGCATDAECAARGTGLVCNTMSHQCEPSGRCTDDRNCAATEACVDGSCRPRSALCQFNYQCGPGQECVDGRCLTQCNPNADAGAQCPAGQVCTNGHCGYPTGGSCNCDPTQICSNGVCLNPCTSDASCGMGFFCDHGVCRVDDRRPPPFCTRDDECAPGSVCRNGVCRASCPSGTNEECLRRDVNFNVCGSDMLCTSTNEQNPQCARSSDCNSGQTCINAICR